MNDVFRRLKKNKSICIVLFLFFVIKLLTLPYYKTIWWDAAVYIGMGKYAYSLGNAGLWEPSRPIVWPIILGLFWKLGFNVVAGRIAETAAAGLCILLTYLIARRLFNKKTALLSSIFLAFFPVFFFFSGIMLTEITSTMFALFGVYFFVGKRHFASGIFFGIAFLTRFLQLIPFTAVVLAILYSNKKNLRLKHVQKLFIGFFAAALPFLALNQALYGNALLPFLQQIFLSRNTGWQNYQPFSYYLTGLFRENLLYFASVLGVFFAFKSKDTGRKAIAIALAFFFLLFSLIKQKEMRFLVVLLPYMCLLMSYSVLPVLNSKSTRLKALLFALILASAAVSLATTYSYYKGESGKYNQYASLQDAFGKADGREIWVSSPVIPVLSSHKAGKLMYYPLFDRAKKEDLIKDLGNTNFVFLDSCDLACKPDDADCETSRNELVGYFRSKLRVLYSSSHGSCTQFVFERQLFP